MQWPRSDRERAQVGRVLEYLAAWGGALLVDEAGEVLISAGDCAVHDIAAIQAAARARTFRSSSTLAGAMGVVMYSASVRDGLYVCALARRGTPEGPVVERLDRARLLLAWRLRDLAGYADVPSATRLKAVSEDVTEPIASSRKQG